MDKMTGRENIASKSGAIAALILARNSIKNRGLEKTLEDIDGALKGSEAFISILVGKYNSVLSDRDAGSDKNTERAWLGLIQEAKLMVLFMRKVEGGLFD